ncbi:hypothetical protein CABS03_02823 [Colletotrichum abscissum]|nr:hypothetical protein CABS02_04468 [Colletotrichum abscissum]
MQAAYSSTTPRHIERASTCVNTRSGRYGYMVVAPAEWHRRRNNTEIGIQREGASPVSSIVSSEWRHGEQQLLSLVPPMVLLRRQASSFAVGHPDTVVHRQPTPVRWTVD